MVTVLVCIIVCLSAAMLLAVIEVHNAFGRGYDLGKIDGRKEAEARHEEEAGTLL